MELRDPVAYARSQLVNGQPGFTLPDSRNKVIHARPFGEPGGYSGKGGKSQGNLRESWPRSPARLFFPSLAARHQRWLTLGAGKGPAARTPQK